MEQATNGAANRNKFTHLFDCHLNSDHRIDTHTHAHTSNRQILTIELIAFTPSVNYKQGFWVNCLFTATLLRHTEYFA